MSPEIVLSGVSALASAMGLFILGVMDRRIERLENHLMDGESPIGKERRKEHAYE